MRYVVEYDENSVAWLVRLDTKARTALVHGMLLTVADELMPESPVQRSPRWAGMQCMYMP